MPLDQIVQTAIALLGPTAIWLSQSRSVRFQRWACIVGLASQPFWFWAVWDSGQWGVAVVAVVCALAWLKGLWVHWIAPRPPAGVGTVALPPESRLK
ncbi:hypothetical protein LJR074_002220 [Acidovorax sp. LjRoot74]|uniref:hypothetical protein n=1 Tax=Acidovorax sp. LjRoot74 TaxID=3342337 RepID=UPI003ED0082F